MQKKKGISLIVLVITIIVMIILAGAIILSLNNAGIIGKANQAVEESNEATVKQLADLKWSEAYLEGNKTASDLREAVLYKLEQEKVDISPYEILVTEKGVVVNRLTTVVELQKQHQFTYYDKLSTAIDDVNAGTIGANALDNKTGAKAGVYTVETTGEDGTTKQEIYIVLLDSYTENVRLRPTVDMTINLGGKELVFEGTDTSVGIDGTNGNTSIITVDGRLHGSKIVNKGTDVASRVFQTRTNTFIINGGTYEAISPITTKSTAIYSVSTVYVSENGKAEINNANLMANVLLENEPQLPANTNTETVQAIVVNCLGEARINHCNISINMDKKVEYTKAYIIGIDRVAKGNSIVSNSKIEINSKVAGENSEIFGVDVKEENELQLSNCTISVVDTESAQTYGIVNRGTITTNNCRVSSTSNSSGVGISNFSKATLIKTNITGSTQNIKNTGTMDIDGKSY